MADNEKVIGKIGDLPKIIVLIDPDGQDRWLVTVSVDMDKDDPASEPSDVISGMHWMRNNGGYVVDVEPADEAAVNAAVEKFRASPPTAEDYARADAQWPLRKTETPS